MSYLNQYMSYLNQWVYLNQSWVTSISTFEWCLIPDVYICSTIVALARYVHNSASHEQYFKRYVYIPVSLPN